MQTSRIVLAALALVASACAREARTPEDVVTEQNLLERERYWPWQVELTRPLAGAAHAPPLEPGASGVLIRIEPQGVARVDFGRDGLREVPIGSTDLVARANRVRSGQLEKLAPHFAFAIGPRLIDPAPRPARALRLEDVAPYAGFLCVFADPYGEDFAALAAALAPLRERERLLTIVFPQGRIRDADVGERLRALGWAVPFVYDHLSDAYTESLLPRSVSPPAVLLQTGEGRVLFESAWAPDVAALIGAAVDAAFPRSGS